MALVVLLKGINVGGHKTFRPSVLARELARFNVVNIGAAGTFVVRSSVSQARLRAEVIRRLPVDAEVMICGGHEILELAGGDPFANQPTGPHLVPFVSVLARRRQPASPLPLSIPASGDWCVRVLTQRGRLVCGIYRRQMQAIRYLAQLERVFGSPATIRNWNTVQAIARALTM